MLIYTPGPDFDMGTFLEKTLPHCILNVLTQSTEFPCDGMTPEDIYSPSNPCGIHDITVRLPSYLHIIVPNMGEENVDVFCQKMASYLQALWDNMSDEKKDQIFYNVRPVSQGTISQRCAQMAKSINGVGINTARAAINIHPNLYKTEINTSIININVYEAKKHTWNFTQLVKESERPLDVLEKTLFSIFLDFMNVTGSKKTWTQVMDVSAKLLLPGKKITRCRQISISSVFSPSEYAEMNMIQNAPLLYYHNAPSNFAYPKNLRVKQLSWERFQALFSDQKLVCSKATVFHNGENKKFNQSHKCVGGFFVINEVSNTHGSRMHLLCRACGLYALLNSKKNEKNACTRHIWYVDRKFTKDKKTKLTAQQKMIIKELEKGYVVRHLVHGPENNKRVFTLVEIGEKYVYSDQPDATCFMDYVSTTEREILIPDSSNTSNLIPIFA